MIPANYLTDFSYQATVIRFQRDILYCFNGRSRDSRVQADIEHGFFFFFFLGRATTDSQTQQ